MSTGPGTAHRRGPIDFSHVNRKVLSWDYARFFHWMAGCNFCGASYDEDNLNVELRMAAAYLVVDVWK
jgi:hypothetical protein